MDIIIQKQQIVETLLASHERQLADFLSSTRKKMLFGQGVQGRIFYECLDNLHVEVEAFLCSKKCNRNVAIPQTIPFYFPEEISAPEECDVFLTLNEKYYQEVMELLNRHGFTHIYYSDDWTRTNSTFRKSVLELYLKGKMGPSFSINESIVTIGDFRMFGIQEPEEYSSMFAGEFFDIIAPSLFNDRLSSGEGAYEDGVVRIEKDDVVFDLGANIGMFACVAATKGRQVFAFEPTPKTAKYLRKNAELYNNFEVVEAAVSDKDGKCSFIINDLSGENVNTGSNTLLAERMNHNMSTKTITVKTVSLDRFVQEHGIERVDFIKADIEGAERYMLEGAKEILKKYAPKLSLCTYHLPDDPEVMKNIILKYNPNYVIDQRENKMYAYVEKNK